MYLLHYPLNKSLKLTLFQMLEILQRLYGENIFFALLSHFFRPRLDQIFQKHQRLVDVPPVPSVVVEPLPHHLHDFAEGHHVVRQIGYFSHDRAAGTPWIVRGCLADLLLGIRVVMGKVFQIASNSSHIDLHIVRPSSHLQRAQLKNRGRTDAARGRSGQMRL
jgi:hypothetical protein